MDLVLRPRLATALFVLPFAGFLLGVIRILDRDLARFLLDRRLRSERGARSPAL